MKRTPLRRTGRLARRTPLRAKGGDRFDAGRDPAYLEWIREQPCCITGKRTGERDFFCGEHDFPMWLRIKVEAAHVRSRGAGGEDRGNVVPLTWRLHAEQHRIGMKTFQEKYSVDLAAIAARLAATHDQEDAGR